MLCGASEL